MKLRIKGKSLRLRVSPSEMMRLQEVGRIEETIRLSADPSAILTYALEMDPEVSFLSIRYAPQHVTVVAPGGVVHRWASSSDVGIYGTLDLGEETLEISVEKDFACLDRSDGENADTFPNPHEGAVC
jgi:hypothetical protein